MATSLTRRFLAFWSMKRWGPPLPRVGQIWLTRDQMMRYRIEYLTDIQYRPGRVDVTIHYARSFMDPEYDNQFWSHSQTMYTRWSNKDYWAFFNHESSGTHERDLVTLLYDPNEDP
jgi:hypothetical protein